MSSLPEKLKALGVQIGAKDLHPASAESRAGSLEKVLAGKAVSTPLGEAFIVVENLPLGSPHGRSRLELQAPMDVLGTCLTIPELADLPAESFLFLDTETTGLSGGTGTYTFLIGAARFTGQEFTMKQFFLRNPAEEPAQLFAFEEFLAPSKVIVTFNGKSFDIPLLQTRFLLHGWQPLFNELIHIDLLHLSRRLWRNRLSNRTLGNLEIQILDADRTEEDVPGWQIPSLYSEYLLDGEADRLKPVFYHNKMDVISLAVLMDHIASLLSDPITGAGAYGADLIGTARLFERIGDFDSAANLYIHGLRHEDTLQNRLPREILLEALTRLAQIYKQHADFETAVSIWQQAASLRHLASYIELAKYYEHKLKDYPAALHWTSTAIQLVEEPGADAAPAPPISNYSRQKMMAALERRQMRLQRKLTAEV